MNAINKSNRFPVAIQGEGFVDATYSDGVWTIGWDAASIQSIGVGEDPGEFLSYNEATETYGRVSFADTPTATAGTDTTQPVHSAGVAAAIAARLGDGVVSYRSVAEAQAETPPTSAASVLIETVAGSPRGAHKRVRSAATPTSYPPEVKHQDASGAWWVIGERAVTIDMFGASPANLDNRAALQTAIDTAAALGLPLIIPPGVYNVAGGLSTRTGLHLTWEPGAELRQTGYSATGSFITNVTADEAGRVQSDITLVYPTLDGSAITYSGDDTHSENGIGFARGASGITIHGGDIRGYAPNFACALGYGGKGLNLDGGCADVRVIGTIKARDCYIGVWVRGNEQLFDATSISQHARRIHIDHIDAEDCQRAFVAMGRDPTEFADAEFPDMDIHVGLLTFTNCGHCPLFPKLGGTTLEYKASAIGFAEAQNVRIDTVRGYIAPTYIADAGGWPAAGPDLVVGEGLTGPIGAFFIVTGKNISIGDVQIQGDADALVSFERDYTAGDDAAHTPDPAQAGKPRIDQFSIGRIVHKGAVTNAVSASPYYAETPGLISGDIRGVTIDTVSGALVASTLDATTALKIEFMSPSGESIRGSAKWLAANYTTTLSAGASTHAEAVKAGQILSFSTGSIPDDGLAVIPNSRGFGWVSVSAANSLLRALISYRTDTSVQAAIAAQPGTQVEVVTTALSAGDGTDGKLTIGFAAGTIFVSNRLGGAATVHGTIFA